MPLKLIRQKVSVFIAKGWAFRPDSALNEIEVDAKEVKAKRETKEFKVEVNTKDDEADQD
jgi:hypothetical protein